MTRYIGRHAGISQLDAIVEMFVVCVVNFDFNAASGWAQVAFYRAEAERYRESQK